MDLLHLHPCHKPRSNLQRRTLPRITAVRFQAWKNTWQTPEQR